MEEYFLSQVPKIDPILTSNEIIDNLQFSSQLFSIPPIGGFLSTSAYLSNHYHLFREDFMRNIKSALNLLYNQSIFLIKELPKTIKDTFYVYTNVLTENINFSPKEALISFNAVPQFLHQSKISEKQLMKGSLLILTDEHFSDFQFLTVFGLLPKSNIFLKNHKRILLAADIGITTLSGQQTINKIKSIYKLGSTGKAILFEAKSYWQGCSPFLNSLQQMINQNVNLPFEDIIVFPENYHCLCPSFINANTQYKINVGFQENNVRVLGDWSHLDFGTLDKSQQKCLKYIITNQISLIQAPPGTGKSFVGSTLVKVYLDNKQQWSPTLRNPILIVCKTNHALDSFIINIEEYTQKIVRMGKRYKDPRVEKYSIDNVKKQFIEEGNKLNTDSYRDLKKINAEIESQYGNITRMSQDLNLLQLTLTSKMKQLLQQLEYKVIDDFTFYFFIQTEESLNKEIFRMWWRGEISTDLLKIHFICPSIEEWNSKQSLKQSDASIVEELFDVDEYDLNEDIEEINFKGAENGFASLSWMLQKNKGSIMSCNENIFKIIWNKIWNKNTNIFELDVVERQIIISFFVQQASQDRENYLNINFEKYIRLMTKNQEQTDQNTSTILSTKDVVCMTLNGAAMNIGVIQKLKPPIIIVEEAGEVLESILIPLLGTSLKQFILIGDHQQLKPISNNYELTIQYNYDTSLLERLINNNIFYASLQFQRRMRPELADYIRLIYDDYEDHNDVKFFPNVKGIFSNMYLINHNSFEDQSNISSSKSNIHEVKYALKMASYFIRIGQFKENQITILSMYLKQVQLLKKQASQMNLNELVIKTVDNYQGEENEIVILSLVRSNPEGKLGFVNVSNRINVAFSRARKGFYCLGNFDMMKSSDQLSTLWRKIINLAESRNQLIRELYLTCIQHQSGKVVNPNDFDYIDCYPCQAITLPSCGHGSSIQCWQLKEYICYELVKYKCPFCNSFPSGPLLTKICCDEFSTPICENLRDKFLPCGHVARVKCIDYNNVQICQELVKYNCPKCDSFPNGKLLTKHCFDEFTSTSCENETLYFLESGQPIKIKCKELNESPY